MLDQYSPNPDFTHPTWHITCGNGGSPSASGGSLAPWTPERVTSHNGYMLLKVEGDTVSAELIGGPLNQVLDKVDDLMAIKR